MNSQNIEMPEVIICEDVTLERVSLLQAEDRLDLIIKNKDYLSQFFDWVHNINNFDDIIAVTEISIDQWENKDSYVFSIFDKKEDLLIGSFTVRVINSKAGCYDLGYWLSQEFNSKGIISDCVQTVTDFLFEEFNANRVDIKVFPSNNIPSMKVAEKTGFTFETVLHDYNILKGSPCDSLLYVKLKNKDKEKLLQNLEQSLKSIYLKD